MSQAHRIATACYWGDRRRSPVLFTRCAECRHSPTVPTRYHRQWSSIRRFVKILFQLNNPLTHTVAVWVQLWSIFCQTGLSRHL